MAKTCSPTVYSGLCPNQADVRYREMIFLPLWSHLRVQRDTSSMLYFNMSVCFLCQPAQKPCVGKMPDFFWRIYHITHGATSTSVLHLLDHSHPAAYYVMNTFTVCSFESDRAFRLGLRLAVISQSPDFECTLLASFGGLHEVNKPVMFPCDP